MDKYLIPSRTCGKCGRIFETSASACPSDGTPFLNLDLDKTTNTASQLGSSGGRLGLLEKTTLTDWSAADSKRVNTRPGSTNSEFRTSAPSTSPQEHGDEHSLVGQILDNQYEILSMIGQGGMSVVYKARHNMLRKIVAIKTMLPHLMVHPFALQRFQQEAQAASNIVHTNVITIYNFGITPEGQPYLVMDYLEGESLADQIAHIKFLPPDRATNIFLQMTNALAHAHKKGVIHRDLKPSNIILVEQGEKKDVVQIVDFGIAKMLPQDGEQALNLTQTGEVFGSPLYMSPEQCKGEKLDHRADIYSLGCLMYETLTGRPPLHGDNTLEVLYKHINEVPPHMSNKEHPIPPKLEAIVFKALAKSPTNRYQTMDDLELDLQSFQKFEQFSILSVFKSRWELARVKRLPQSRREKVAATSITLAVVAVLSALCYPTVATWNLASSSMARTPMLLDDDRRAATTRADEVNSKAFEIARKQAEQYVAGNSTDQDNATLYSALMRHGRYYSDLGYFSAAYRAYAAAVDFSKKMNGEKSFPTQRAYLELANVAYDMGRWKEAQLAYLKFLPLLTDMNRDGFQKAFYCARLGNCFWNGEDYAPAKFWYKQAIAVWAVRIARAEHDAHSANSAGDTDYVLSNALARTRLAMIYQHELDSLKTDNLLEPDYKKMLKRESCAQLFTALPLWRQSQVENSKNEGICELQLAKAFQNDPQAKDVLKLQTNKPDLDTADDTSVPTLLRNGTEALKKNCGANSLYYALGLLRLADYAWQTHDYEAAVKYRWAACTIMSQNSQNESKRKP